jgi:4-hydroxy-2-oxoheptanedioate aldolase
VKIENVHQLEYLKINHFPSMKENIVKNNFLAGKPVLGVISNSSDPTIAEICGFAGLGFYMIDGEHSTVTTSELQNIVRACECSGITPLARIRSNDPKMILQFMDAGIMGIMMPGMSNKQDVVNFVRAMKYFPEGDRGLGPVRSSDYMLGKMTQAEYVQFSNRNTLVLPMFEDIKALENLDEMCQVGGIDGFIIGPRDLAMSMGFIDGPAHQEVKDVIDQVFEIVLKHNLIVGTVAATAEQAKVLTDKGAKLILNSVQGLLNTSATAFLKQI